MKINPAKPNRVHSPANQPPADAHLVATVWEELREDATHATTHEPALAPMLQEFVLAQPSLGHAIAYRLGEKLVYHSERGAHLDEAFREAFDSTPAILAQIAADLRAIVERDPACDSLLIPFLYFKGFQAITCHRIAHWLWSHGRTLFALHIQSLVSEVFAVDIHPAAKIGSGILLDHATGFVAGETAIIENDVSLLHDVTLGGTGKERGDRHPKIRRGVLIGAGAKILGNIEIGEGAKIGAGSVVLDDVPPHTTVVGVPAEPIEDTERSDFPALSMRHNFGKPALSTEESLRDPDLRALSLSWTPEI